MQNVSLKSLQEDAADDISRRHFQMQIFLALYGLNIQNCHTLDNEFEIFKHLSLPYFLSDFDQIYIKIQRLSSYFISDTFFTNLMFT